MVDFGKMRDLYDLQKKARRIQKELKETEIEAESNDGWVRVIFNGEQHLTDIEIADEAMSLENKLVLQKDIKNAVTQAIARAQAHAAEKMKDIAGKLNIPGL